MSTADIPMTILRGSASTFPTFLGGQVGTPWGRELRVFFSCPVPRLRHRRLAELSPGRGTKIFQISLRAQRIRKFLIILLFSEDIFIGPISHLRAVTQTTWLIIMIREALIYIRP